MVELGVPFGHDGMFGGFVCFDRKFDPISGACTKAHIAMMYIWSLVECS